MAYQFNFPSNGATIVGSREPADNTKMFFTVAVEPPSSVSTCKGKLIVRSSTVPEVRYQARILEYRPLLVLLFENVVPASTGSGNVTNVILSVTGIRRQSDTAGRLAYTIAESEKLLVPLPAIMPIVTFSSPSSNDTVEPTFLATGVATTNSPATGTITKSKISYEGRTLSDGPKYVVRFTNVPVDNGYVLEVICGEESFISNPVNVATP
ncbi:MAG: hypothetical protein U0746_08795 [Gemmataceae bacterium]